MRRRREASRLLAACLASIAATATAVAAPAAKGIRVEGKRLFRDGQPFVPLGFTMIGLLSPTRTGIPGVAADHYGQAELDAAKAWNANTLRFQISQRGFDPQDTLHSAAYVRRVKDGVALARANDFVVILSMQDQSYSGGDATPMPEPQTLRSWDEVTKHFNGDPHVMYELWNEPMVKDSAAEWKLWRDGGVLGGRTVVGHQELVNRVRSSGATNVLIVEGTRVGKSFIRFPGLNDPRGQLAFGIHPYLNWPINDPAKWDGYFGDFSRTHPVIATEWNSVSSSKWARDEWATLAQPLLSYLKAKEIGLTAWAFDIVDTLVKDWNWTPTTLDGWTLGVRGYGAGQLVKAHFASYRAATAETYNHYFGNTHSHTQYSDGAGTPAEHFRLAKTTGFDFYAVTDHALAKYPSFTPASYQDTKRKADEFTDASFVAIAGFEYSENDGAAGTGHLNALNTVSYLDATGGATNLPVFYDWLVGNRGTIHAASFNHPGDGSYNSFDYLTDARRDEITMFEVINSGNLHYGAFLTALNKGWRVAPVAGLDNHGLWRITKHFYRTGVLAPSLTREDILRAMRARRVYCTWDPNLRVAVRANGQMMGSVLRGPSVLTFEITVTDPDAGDANDRATKVELIGQNGDLVASQTFSAHSVTWNPSCNAAQSYYFVRVHCADKTDGPTAYSAPFWVEGGRPPSPPAAPTGLSAQATSQSDVSLSWTDNSPDEAGFRLERKAGVARNWTQVATPGPGVTSYADSGLGASAEYRYRLSACNAAGSSAWSKEASATTLPSPPPAGPGKGILREVWTGVSGSATADLTKDARYPASPSSSSIVTSFEGPINSADNYGTRLRGYVIPPLSGGYVFRVAGDDEARLWLSAAGEDPAGAAEIARVPGWTNSREWTKYAEQTSAKVTLQAGKGYYVEVLHKEGTGGDNVAVMWRLPSGAVESPIPGHRLDPWVEAEPRGPHGAPSPAPASPTSASASSRLPAPPQRDGAAENDSEAEHQHYRKTPKRPA